MEDHELNKEEQKAMLKGMQGVIFDFDGTLADSMDMWHQIDIEYTAAHGIDMPEDLQQQVAGMCFREVAEYFKAAFGISDTPDEIMAEWHEMAFQKYANQILLKPGAREYLDKLKKEGFLLGIATSNSRDLLNASLQLHGLKDFFDGICTGDDVTKGKPDPELYLTAARMMGADPSACLVFEEIPLGIQAGKNAGMRVCAVEDGTSSHLWEEKKSMSDYAIHSFKELL